MTDDAFVTAVLCIDGRYRRCLVDWLSDHYRADYVDLITEPGPDRVLTDALSDAAQAVRRRVDVSIRAHASQAIAIVGHDDCAGNPVDPGTHRSQIAHAVGVLRGWYPQLPILGVFVDATCQVHIVESAETPTRPTTN